MKRAATALILLLSTAACSDGAPGTGAMEAGPSEAELLSGLEDTRNAFMAILKEKRYQDLGTVVTQDLIAVAPGSEEWAEVQALAAERGVPFAYDSIFMEPMETVLVTDDVAWDMGTSRVFFTNSRGESREVQDTYLAILKRDEAGVWRLHREVASARVQ